MKRNGFTLIELLAVIVIIATVSLLTFPAITGILKDSKEGLYNTQVLDIEAASKKWAITNISELDSNHLNNLYLPLSYLQYLKYLENDSIKNPITKEQMNGCIEISYDDDNSQYKYNYLEDTCPSYIASNTVNGYAYEEVSGVWTKVDHNSLTLAYQTIIKNNNIFVNGETTAGLYEFNDYYIFRGETVNNVVKINSGSDLWRIISIDKKNNNIKLVKVTSIAENVWNSPSSIIFEQSSLYSGILTDYINNEVNSINSIKEKIDVNATWDNGTVDGNTGSYTTLKANEGKKTIYANVGLLTVGDYVGASLNSQCNDSYMSANCNLTNYLTPMLNGKTAWTMNNNGTMIWTINTSGNLVASSSTSLYSVFPAVILKTNISISGGSGTTLDPYIIIG